MTCRPDSGLLPYNSSTRQGLLDDATEYTETIDSAVEYVSCF